MHRKDSPVCFYHYVQSFHPDEPISGELAHEVAKEFAARAWPDSEVLIDTHIDARHIHSHFIVNAVCYETGQMLRQEPKTLATLRPLSDEICLAHDLSVLPKQQKKANGISTREYRAAVKGESWKFRLINVIDDCMKYAHPTDFTGVVGGVVELGHAMERNQFNPPVKDATTMPQQIDSKARRKESEKKIGLGRSSDDYEKKEIIQQTMY